MLAAEGGVLALVGAAAGLVAGVAISSCSSMSSTASRSTGAWSCTALPFARRFPAILVILAVVTAVVSSREAMGMGPVRAVREDW